ncbi:SDR family oxidoreductase [Janthinobacterium sp.]|uniref:SDR family oxidoreductase n=1 Tax=Janthinobacterium sp. TaxID=1871054 RepID=UPI0025851E85|nr:SDR family oxidoreductase [Janthinobacterium sp.]MCX7293665.1 SDR family oxidoreductase [Janthinobacterium sp.]
MNKVLLTGATGFVGSTLAAGFLARSIPVVVVSRNDPDGERTESAILEAAQGCGWNISNAIRQHLDVINVDFSDLEQCIPDDMLTDITVAWHCSAEMSYSSNKLASSFETNVGNSTRLFALLRDQAPKLQRFYYMSTAYVAGMQGGAVPERLHAGARLINPYQISKWSAERALQQLHLESGVPLTIFRPSIVTGHRKSGWATRNGFGFYMFLDALRAFSAAGYEHLTVDLKPGVRPDLIAIDQLADDALSLTLRQEQRAPFEIFHCTGGLGLNTHELMAACGAATGVRVSYGPALTSLEQKFSRATDVNMPFANQEWQFARSALDCVLDRPAAPALSRDDVAQLIAWYVGADAHAAAASQSALAN